MTFTNLSLSLFLFANSWDDMRRILRVLTQQTWMVPPYSGYKVVLAQQCYA